MDQLSILLLVAVNCYDCASAIAIKRSSQPSVGIDLMDFKGALVKSGVNVRKARKNPRGRSRTHPGVEKGSFEPKLTVRK